MTLVPLVTDDLAPPEVRVMFDDMRATRKTDYINNIWRALARDPKQLQMTWSQVKAMMGPGALDPVTKELIYLAVSATNNCEYCLHTHRIAIGLQVPVDARYRTPPF